jgi:hypothetical protein
MEFQVYVKEHPRTVILHPIDNKGRVTLSFSAESSHSKVFVNSQSSDTFKDDSSSLLTSCYGCVGFIPLNNGMQCSRTINQLRFDNMYALEIYIALISNCSRVAELPKKSFVYKILGVQFYSLKSNQWDHIYSSSVSGSSATGFAGGYTYGGYLQEEAVSNTVDANNFSYPFSNLAKLFTSGTFYFSPNFDLTKSFQEHQSTKKCSIHQHFLWNSYMIGELQSYRNHLPPQDQAKIDRSGIIVSFLQVLNNSSLERL